MLDILTMRYCFILFVLWVGLTAFVLYESVWVLGVACAICWVLLYQLPDTQLIIYMWRGLKQ